MSTIVVCHYAGCMPRALALCCALLGMTSPLRGADEVPFTTVEWGQSSEIRRPRLVVIRTQHGFNGLWQEHQRTFVPGHIRIDFNRFMVIGAFAGEMPSTASGVSIRSIERDRRGLLVHYGYCRGVGLGDMLTYPYHLVAVPSARGPVRFVEEWSDPRPACPIDPRHWRPSPHDIVRPHAPWSWRSHEPTTHPAGIQTYATLYTDGDPRWPKRLCAAASGRTLEAECVLAALERAGFARTC